MNLRNTMTASAIALGLATCAMADSNFSGAYLGGNFGYGIGKTEHNNNEVAPNNNQTDFGSSGFVGGFHGGYQYQFGMFVLGGEGSFNLSNTEGTNKSDYATGTAKSSIKRKNAYGLAARLGLALNSWMVYTKLGWERARFDMKVSGTALAANDFSKKKNINAFVAGLGFETLVANNIMVGGEWTTSFYKKTSFVAGANADKFKPTVSDFKIRLGYKF